MSPRNLRIHDFLGTPERHNTYNRELFSILAGRYDAFTRGLSVGRDVRWKAKLIGSLPPLSRPRCLDIACGTGDLALMLSERYPDGEITGIDLTPAMVEEARRKCVSRNISLDIQDMCELSFADSSFDIVTAGYAIRNAPDLRKALGEVRRVLRPAGTFGILEFSKPRGRFLQNLERALLRAWGAACGLVYYRDAGISASIPVTLETYPDARRLESLLRELGFSHIRSTALLLGVARTILCRASAPC